MNFSTQTINAVCLFCFVFGCAQKDEIQEDLSTLPSVSANFADFVDFKFPEKENWKLVGGIYADRKVNKHLTTEAGTGILVNIPNDNSKSNLYSNFEHGDIDFDTEFLLPKGSNSGLYFQGRYEVQLYDSWGNDSLSYSDNGAIYQRWDSSMKSGFEGTPPILNASRSPGLWQHLKVRFKAPKFDKNGKKTTNARFEYVILNGSIVQENVEVSGPTRDAFFDNESSSGPLVIQGDHGPVAFRNTNYKVYSTDKLSLTNINYEVYKGSYQKFDTIDAMTPVKTNQTDSISYEVSGGIDFYAIEFSGEMDAPIEGTYIFETRAYGPTRLIIDDKIVIDNKDAQNMLENGTGSVPLSSGSHSYKLIYLKNNRPWRQGLSLTYEGPNIPKSKLHAFNSVPKPEEVAPILLKANKKNIVQRGFFNFEGEKLTHTILVGTTDKLNYAYDLNSASLVSAWRGEFANATDMWQERGTAQLAKPLGSQINFYKKPILATLDNADSAWPDTVDLEDNNFRFKGYQLDSANIPSFEYSYKDALLFDKSYPSVDGNALVREIHVKYEKPVSNLHCILAEGSSIVETSEGNFVVNDNSYYLELLENVAGKQPIIRSKNGIGQLLLPLAYGQSPIKVKYQLIW